MIKLSDYITKWLEQQHVHTVFGYQGSSISHVIHSISMSELITFVETRHEQAAAFAANAYANIAKEGFGVAVACSGPGGINLFTGIANAYYDSIPCLFFVGQVSMREMKKDSEMRQYGFQEADILSAVKPFVKYVKLVDNPEEISDILECAKEVMLSGRKGPAVIILPHNIQSAKVKDICIREYIKEKSMQKIDFDECIIKDINNSHRPLIIIGGGCDKLRTHTNILDRLEKLGIPIVTSFRGKDCIPADFNNYFGVIGVYGNRYANWLLHYSDYVLAIGSRLDERQIAGDVNRLLQHAKITVVDIDQVEQRNKPAEILKVNEDAVQFLRWFLFNDLEVLHKNKWITLAKKWKSTYLDINEYKLENGCNPNLICHLISVNNLDKTIYTLDVGQNQLWGNASLVIKKNQRMLQSAGLGSMGYSLPAAIGAYFASETNVICLSGDGGIQMNIQELQTVQLFKIPIKIIIFNNQSLGLIRIYQDKVLEGKHFGTIVGFGNPDYQYIAKAYGMRYYRITDESTIVNALQETGAVLIEVIVSDQSTNYPEPTYLSTIENQSYELSKKVLKEIEREAYSV